MGGRAPAASGRLTGATVAVAALTLASLSACGAQAPGPPEIVVDRSACSHCRMFISEPVYAAAYQAPDAEARVFDDIACLLAAARAETGPLRYWVHDAADGEWIDGDTAVLVRSPEIRTPMAGGIIAFRTRAAADAAAARHHGRVVPSLQALLAEEGERR
jgi:copper chaperone NosL